MIVLGIDPGLAIVGFGVVSYDGVKPRIVDYGTLTTPAGMPLPDRLLQLYEGATELVQRYQPDDIAFEELFFAKNITTAIPVAQARGVTVAALRAYTSHLYEYTPMQVKLAVTGDGRADKRMMQQMVKMLLGLKETPKPDDAADALAIAICHAHSMRMRHEFAIK